MKVEIELPHKEAREIFGQAIAKAVFSDARTLRIEEVEWNRYSHKVRITLTDEPEDVATDAAA